MSKEDKSTKANDPKSDVAAPDKNAASKARLNELLMKKQEIQTVLNPARKIHDEIVNDPRLIEARKVIKDCSKKLGPIDQEIAVLSRGLGGRVMRAESGKYTKEELSKK